MQQPADINYDADFFTKHPGISTRSLWTVEEATKEENRLWEQRGKTPIEPRSEYAEDCF
jgi:hypothetical protein